MYVKGSVWGGTQEGRLVEWSEADKVQLRVIDLKDLIGAPYLHVNNCIRVADTLWVGTGTKIVIIDLDPALGPRRGRYAGLRKKKC